jgi:hypothetical protein
MARRSSPEREAERLAAEDRRRQCMALRVGGASIAEIGRALNLSKSTVHGHVNRALAELAKADHEQTARYRALSMQRLDGLLKAIWVKATNGADAKLVREARFIVMAQARLLGLEAPVKVAHTDPTGEHERRPQDWIMPMPTEQDPHEWAATTRQMLEDREAVAGKVVAEFLGDVAARGTD